MVITLKQLIFFKFKVCASIFKCFKLPWLLFREVSTQEREWDGVEKRGANSYGFAGTLSKKNFHGTYWILAVNS